MHNKSICMYITQGRLSILFKKFFTTIANNTGLYWSLKARILLIYFTYLFLKNGVFQINILSVLFLNVIKIHKLFQMNIIVMNKIHIEKSEML